MFLHVRVIICRSHLFRSLLSPFKEDIKHGSIPVPLPHLHAVSQLAYHAHSGTVSPRRRSFRDLYLLIRPTRKTALGRGRNLIPGFTRFFLALSVYDVAPSLPLGGVFRDFPFTEDETQRYFSYLRGSFREYCKL